MANYFYKGKEVRSRSDRDRDIKLSWTHTVTLKHTDINFRFTDSVATLTRAIYNNYYGFNRSSCMPYSIESQHN